MNILLFSICQMGEQVAAADFSEFNAAYDAFKETTRHREEIQTELEQHAKTIVFVEGDYDIRYLKRAAEWLDKNEILNNVQLKDGGGCGNLDKIWRGYDNPMSASLPNKIILLYDCDTNKQDASKNRVYKRTIPPIADNPIAIGIENLFSVATIKKIEDQNPRFIDTQEQANKRVRSETITIPATKSVNPNEKGNMCNWLCEHGTVDDFVGFQSVFDIIEPIINN